MAHIEASPDHNPADDRRDYTTSFNIISEATAKGAAGAATDLTDGTVSDPDLA